MGGVSEIDVNLLTALGALLEERNLTRATTRLNLSQPTMSGALARLRRHFDDELLVREGRGYVLTPAAQRLLPAVQRALCQVERTLLGTGRGGAGWAGSEPVLPGARRDGFDPVTSRRQFSVGMPSESVLMLRGLLRQVHQAAPRIRLDLRAISTEMIDGERTLLAHDVLIAPRGFLATGQPEVVYRDRFVFVADARNPRLRDGRLTLADLAALPHAAARRPAADADAVTAALADRGVGRNVVLTASGWLALPFMIAGTDLVAAVPERLARMLAAPAGLTVVEPPFGNVELAQVAWWHPMHATDPALTWLRGLFREAAAAPQADTASPASAVPLAVTGSPA
jgi:DNA-binding transcriptional LysR family regulator